MTREQRKVTLWTSNYSDRSGLEKVNVELPISNELKGKIQAAFSSSSSDERIKMYASVTDNASLARVFG
ncbi:MULTISPECIES: hypothetical protein [Shewanella]|uniref:hypothetical protein n=1 Tax=Shewanella TaxID=22 RepID=UPI0012ECD123|nr:MULTISPECIES: hypothetical protein [unclassified Shewanella]MBW3517329.1 hypothetical protein [Shewanella sp. NKUCC01_JLK]